MHRALLAVILAGTGLLSSPAQVVLYNPAFGGSCQSDIDLGGHRLANFAANGASQPVRLDAAGHLPALDGSALTALSWGQLHATPTSLAGYGIADPVLLSTGSYANPAWLASLASSKLSGALPALDGSALTGLNASSLAAGSVPAARMPALTGDVTTAAGSLATAVKASVALTGAPSAPTAAAGTSTTQIASTAFVQAAVAPLGGFKNVLVGGDFSTNPWQLGSSFTGIGATAFAATRIADRFFLYGVSSGGNFTASRVAVTDLPGVSFALRIQRPAGNTSTAGFVLKQIVESANAVPLQGKTVTLSFWARAGATLPSSSLQAAVQSGTGTDEGSFSSIVGFTGNAFPLNNTVTITTAWTRYAVSAALPASERELALHVGIGTLSGTAGASDQVDIADIQLEAGPAATGFEALPPEAVLARCQRYHQVHAARVGTASSYLGWALPVGMRAAPAISGGGAGFTVATPDAEMVDAYQTAAGTQTLVLDAEL